MESENEKKEIKLDKQEIDYNTTRVKDESIKLSDYEDIINTEDFKFHFINFEKEYFIYHYIKDELKIELYIYFKDWKASYSMLLLFESGKELFEKAFNMHISLEKTHLEIPLT